VIERSRVRRTAGALPRSLGQLSLPSLREGKSSTSLLAGVKAASVHWCRVAGNMCDPTRQVTSRSCATGFVSRIALPTSLSRNREYTYT